jgi:hypothetical protein
MNSFVLSPKRPDSEQSTPETPPIDRNSALQELDRILASRYFKSADRSKQFLKFVVLNKLDGTLERLKERTIGIEVFHRPAGYATGEDPVVRVQAGEVRRRLEQYYAELSSPPALRIELPVGSYSPLFHLGSDARSKASRAIAVPPERKPANNWKFTTFLVVATAIVIVVIGRGLINPSHKAADSKSGLDLFWGPAITSQQPVLICIANATDHSAEEKLLQARAQQLGSSAAANRFFRLQESESVSGQTPEGLPISPEIVPASDASVAFALSGLFGRLAKPSQLRIGAAATYEDLRSFPAVVIGGFNSKWTMDLISNLHFAFLRENGEYMIREEVPGGRVWTTRTGIHGEDTEDFAIVARLIDSKTGQFTITVAGIGPRGTQAAGEFVTSNRYMEDGLAKVPADWQNRNLEILLQTTVTDSMAGPPHVIAAHAW